MRYDEPDLLCGTGYPAEMCIFMTAFGESFHAYKRFIRWVLSTVY
jgi:hypothetical protein